MKKINFKKLLEYFFVFFLLFYLYLTISDILHLDFDNLNNFIYLILGLFLALFAHAKRNSITILLLVIHMSIEWFEWSQNFTLNKEIIINIIHVLMDFGFLSHELSVHIKKHRYKLLTIISLLLISIFAFSKYLFSDIYGIENIVAIAGPFVLGGILGCVASHLIRYSFKKQF